MITGFQAKMSVNDGVADADTPLTGLVTFNLPSLEAETFDATELDQDDGGTPAAADPMMRTAPTGLIKVGPAKCEIKFTKANYSRLRALLMLRGKTYKLASPDDQTSGTPTKVTCTFQGFVSKVDDLKFEKSNAAIIPFEITVEKAPAYT